MKYYIFETPYEMELVGSAESFDRDLLVTFRGAGRGAAAKALKEILEKKCPECGGLNGHHNKVFRGRSNGLGDVEGSDFPCPLEGKK